MDKIDLRPRPSAEVALIRELVGAVPFAQPFLNYFSALAGSEVGEVTTAINNSLIENLEYLFDEMRARDSRIRSEITAGRLTAEAVPALR